MKSRKYFCVLLILLISLIGVSAVSAADDSNDIFSINTNEDLILEQSINEDVLNTANEELILEETNNPDLADLDSLNEVKTDDNIGEKSNNDEITGNNYSKELLKDDSNLSNEIDYINITQENNFLFLSAIDNEGNYITEGNFTITSKEGYKLYGSLYGMNSIYINLFHFPYEEYPQNLSIDFIGDEGQIGHETYLATLENTLIAHDVVDEFTFEVQFLANNYIPVPQTYMNFRILDEDGDPIKSVNILTDIDGKVILDYALDPGNYKIYVENTITSQYGIYSWNISERNKAKETRINVTIDGYNLKYTILDGLDNPLNERLDLYVNDTYYANIYGGTYNVYQLGEGHQELYLEFNDDHYFSSNASLSVDNKNTIIVEDYLYNTTNVTLQIIDYEGNPIKSKGTSLYVGDELYYKISDEEGYVSYDLNLLPSIYNLRILNPESLQSKNIILEVIEEYDAKKASLDVYQDKYNFIITATDFYGNRIDEGQIQVEHEESLFLPIKNGTAVFNYVSPQNIYDNEVRLTFTLKNDNYYNVQTIVTFNATDTIISNDVQPGKIFNATMLDMDKNPIEGMEVVFSLYDRTYFTPMGNFTAITDENGVASVEAGDKYFDYIVSVTNELTHQSKSYIWTHKLNANVTPVADYFDESTGIYYINGHTLTLKINDDANGRIRVDDGDEFWDEYIVDGYCSIYLLELKRYDVEIYYYGDLKYIDEIFNYTIIASKMKNVNMSISEDLIINYLDGSNFIVNLTNDQGPISNASVEIRIANLTYTAVTDDNGIIQLPIDVAAGTYDVFVAYKGSPSYLPLNKTTKLTVNKAESNLTASDINATYNINKDFIISLMDSQANPIIGSPVFVDINGLRLYSTDSNGQIKIGTKSLSAGNYTATILFSGDKNYESSSATAKVTVKKDSTKLTAKATSTIYNVKKNLVITLRDSLSKAIKGAKLTVKIGTSSKTYTTDKNGQVKVNIASLIPKTYLAKISFAGNNNYIKSSASAKIVVKKANSKLAAKSKSFKRNLKVKKYAVTLKNNINKPIKKAKLILKVKGKTYLAKTNNKGQAIFAIKNLNIKGNYIAAISFGGDKYYKKASKKIKIGIR